MASNCTLGIQNLVKTTLNNKPWFQYDQSLGIVNILDSFTKKINKENSHGVAKTTAITINKQINDGYKNIGDIAFVKSNKEGRGYIDIAPTINQIYLINAQNEKEINELQQQLDEEELLKGFYQTRETGNYDVVDGEIVVSTNNGFNNEYSLNNFQEEQEELDKIVTKINNESRQLDLFESFQNIITNENKPTPIDTTKSAGLLWGKMSSYESETNFQPTESKSQYRSDNSLQEKINGRSFKEIWNSNEFTQLERENILLHSIQKRMLDKNSFNGELFAGINSKLGKLELRVVDNEKYPFLAFQKQIYINPKTFLKYLQNANIEDVDKYLDLTVSEELIHVLTNYFTSLEDIKKIATEINPNNFKYIQSIYKSLPSGDFELGTREYLRMIVQQEILGTTTEKIKYTKNGVIDSIIDKIWNFLYQIFKDNKGTLAENVKKHIDFIKSNNVDSTNNYKSDIFQVETSLSQNIKYQLSKEQSDAIDNVFDENPELDSIGTQQLYSQYLEQNPNGSVEQFKSWVNNRNDLYYQVKNIFNTVKELEDKLKSLNKTANSIGSEKNIDDILKKAGLESDFRKEFLQLLKDNPSLKSLKLSEVISSYLKEFVKESDRQYYTAIEEPLSEELENVLIDYFDKFHIRRKQLDNLKEKFGVDSIGIFDVLAKTIYYSKNRNLLTLPEEYGHVFIELLGSISNKKADNPLFKYLFDNIESWDGYQRVFRDYKNLYVTAEGNIDIYKIKKEAIGQAIGIALVRNYKVQKGDKGFWSKIQEVIDYILGLIKGIDYVSLNTTVDSIAKDILSNNYSKLDRLNKDTSNYNLLSYSETLKTQNKKDGGKALKFMQWFSQKGMIITGSLAYRLQGNVYRPEIDALHDIDNIVPSDVHKLNLNKSNFLNEEQLEKDKIYRNLITEGNYKEAKQYKIQGNLKLGLNDVLDQVEVLKDFKKEFPDTDFLYSFFNQKANAYYVTINAIWSENQELKDRFKSYSGSFNNRLANFTEEELSQLYLFDFFLRPETSTQYKQIEDKEYGLNLAHFNYSFYEKLNMMGRAKDAYDYQMWNYFDENNILAPDFNDRLVYFQINQSQQKQNQIQEVFNENPELSKIGTVEQYSQYLDSQGINIEEGNLRSQIQNIASNSQYEHNKRLAEYLLDFNFDKNDFFRFAEDFAQDFKEFGLYYKDENELKNISIKANKIAKEIPISNRQYFEEQVLLHETIHLLTVDNLNKNKEIKAQITTLMQIGRDKLDISKYSNAFSSEAEFIAHVFSDYNFQKELKQIPYEKSNVWNKFISLIQDMAKYLGINVENSLLEKIVEVSQPLFVNKLGSKQDIQGFKEFISNNTQKTEDYFSNEINKIQKESKVIENFLKEYETSKKIDNRNTTKAIKNKEEKTKETNNKLLSLGFEFINENEYQFSTSSYITFKSKLNSLEGIDVSINTFKSPDYLIKIKIAPLKNNFDLQKQGELPFNPIELKLALKENDFIQDIADNTFEGLTEEQINILRDNLENGELNLNCKI